MITMRPSRSPRWRSRPARSAAVTISRCWASDAYHANRVGLYSEEITLSGVQLATSHRRSPTRDAALTLDEALDRGSLPMTGRARMRSGLAVSSPRSPTGSRGR